MRFTNTDLIHARARIDNISGAGISHKTVLTISQAVSLVQWQDIGLYSAWVKEGWRKQEMEEALFRIFPNLETKTKAIRW